MNRQHRRTELKHENNDKSSEKNMGIQTKPALYIDGP